MTRRCIALDVHREFAQVAIWQDGLVRQAGQIATTPEALAFLTRHRRGIGPGVQARHDRLSAAGHELSYRSGRCPASSTARGAVVERARARRAPAASRPSRRLAPIPAPPGERRAGRRARASEGVPLSVIQRRLGHADLGTPSI